MQRPQRVLGFFAMTFFFSSLFLVVCSSGSSSGVASKEDMETYVQIFLTTYNEELNDNFRPQVRKYFPFHSEYLYSVNATISNVRGVALEFTPWDQEVIEYKTIDTKVESTVFGYVNLNLASVEDSAGYKVVISRGLFPYEPFLTINAHAHVVFSDIIFVTNEARFVEVKEGGELFLSNVIVDERLFHTLIVRGTSDANNWTAIQAVSDAHSFLQIHLWWAFNQSEEFREYLAYPELSQLLEAIVQRHLYEEGYDLMAFKEDLTEVRDLARDKYRVSTEFVDEILDYIERILMAPPSPPPWEVAPWSWILGFLVALVLEEFIRRAYKRWLAPKKTRTGRRGKHRRAKR